MILSNLRGPAWILVLPSALSLQAQETRILGVPEDGLLGSSQACHLSAKGEYEFWKGQHHWEWSIVGRPEDGELTRLEDGSVLFQAPYVAGNPKKNSYVVRVEDKNAGGPMFSREVILRVVRDLRAPDEAADPEEARLPPDLAPLAGKFGEAGHHSGPFHEIQGVYRIQDPQMGKFAKGWLVSDQDGLTFVDPRGRVTPVLKAADLEAGVKPDSKGTEAATPPENAFYRQPFRITAVAVRPPDSLESNPHHVVFACGYGIVSWDEKEFPEPKTRGFLFELLPDGTTRLIAGSMPKGPGDGRPLPKISCMTMDPAGNLLLGDQTFKRIRRLTPTGELSTYLEEMYVPGPGRLVVSRSDDSMLGSTTALAWDAKSGTLFFASRHSIAAVGPDRTVGKILGDMGSLFPMEFPEGLLFHQGALYVADAGYGRILRIDPSTWKSDTVAGHSGSGGVRFGPLQPAEGKGTGSCASLTWPQSITLGFDLSLVVGLSNGVVELSRVLPPAPSSEPREDAADNKAGSGAEQGRDPSLTTSLETKASVPPPTATRVEAPVVHSGPAPAAAKTPAPVLYSVSKPRVERGPEPLSPGGVVTFSFRRAGGWVPSWGWSASAGKVQDLGKGKASFTIPANAASGSSFRITVRFTSPGSVKGASEAYLDMTLP
jgi:hypothetical protein